MTKRSIKGTIEKKPARAETLVETTVVAAVEGPIAEVVVIEERASVLEAPSASSSEIASADGKLPEQKVA